MKCSICNVGPAQDRNLYRDENTKEWRCVLHLNSNPPVEVTDLVNVVGPETTVPAQTKSWDNMGCSLAGPGRGDCFHFIGYPSPIHKPGQHDGFDDTVDSYGKPNGWCWSCWKDYRLEKALSELSALKKGMEIPTEQQAIAMTMTCAIPEDFCRYVYADWSTREGRDGANCPVCWLPYVKKRWEREKMAWAAKTHNGNKEAKGNGAVRSVMDLRTVLMAKESLATQIREKYSSNAAVGLNWNDETKRQEYRTLRREIGEITRQIAGMA